MGVIACILFLLMILMIFKRKKRMDEAESFERGQDLMYNEIDEDEIDMDELEKFEKQEKIRKETGKKVGDIFVKAIKRRESKKS